MRLRRNPEEMQLVAIVYQVRTQALLCVATPAATLVGEGEVLLSDGERDFGTGVVVPHVLGACARPHLGVTQRGAGYGLALYTALAAVAYMGYGDHCIASCPPGEEGDRSPEASRWWAAQVRRGLATPLSRGCAAIELQSLIDQGLVFWMAEPGEYERALRAARERFLEAFAAAEPPYGGFEDLFGDALDVIDAELSELLSDWALSEWRRRLSSSDFAVNGRRRRPQPRFVTPAVRRRVEQLYAPLSGDDL